MEPGKLGPTQGRAAVATCRPLRVGAWQFKYGWKAYVFQNALFNNFIMMIPRCGMFFYIYKYLYYTMISCDDEATRWLSVWYTYIYNDFVMMICHEDMVMLRSTTGPYGWSVIEVAYGEMIFHSTEAVWEMIAREEWLGCRHDVAHVGHTRVNTSVGSMCIVFWIFILKTLNIYI